MRPLPLPLGYRGEQSQTVPDPGALIALDPALDSLCPVTETPAPDAPRGRRVVIAEDEALIRLDLAEMLEEEGYDVVGLAEDGEKAVALAEELRPDLVILDIGRVVEGDTVVIIAGSPPGIPGSTNAVRVHQMGDAVNEVAPAYHR